MQLQAEKEPQRVVEAVLDDGRVLHVREPGRRDTFAVLGGFLPMVAAMRGKQISEQEEAAGYGLCCRLAGIPMQRLPETPPEAVVLDELSLVERMKLINVVYELVGEKMAGVPLVSSTPPQGNGSTSNPTSDDSSSSRPTPGNDSPAGPASSTPAASSGETTGSPQTT
jgi:hypothetical protein